MKKNESPHITIVDIGAAGGIDKKWEKVDYTAILFDANPSATYVDHKNWIVISEALSNSRGKKKLYVAKKHTNSSFYEPNADLINRFPKPGRFGIEKIVEVKTDTLDHVLSSRSISDVDHIKLDVQGHEFFILQGAANYLKKAISVEVEVMFAPMYKGQPLFSETDAFLRENGFELHAFSRLTQWKRGLDEVLVWGEAVYFKNISALTLEKRERHRMLKSILCEKNDSLWKKTNIRHRVKLVKQKAKDFLKRRYILHPAKDDKISGMEKVAILLQHKTPEVRIFAETGTSTGATLDVLFSHFDRCFSVEVERSLYESACIHFKNKKNVTLLFGDSAEKLKDVLVEIKEPALFWLDAHGDGEITANNSPIIGELDAIFHHRIKLHRILIDDARHFSTETIRTIDKMARGNGYTMSIQDGLFRILPDRHSTLF